MSTNGVSLRAYTPSLHDALPISAQTRENYPGRRTWGHSMAVAPWGEVIGQIGHDPGFFIVDLHRETLQLAEDRNPSRSEEHTSELQSRGHLVCRLLLEKKKT